MALFTRNPAKRIAKAYNDAKTLVEAVEKNGAVPGPANYGGVNGASTITYVPGQPYNFGPGDVGNPQAGQVVPLARPFDEFGAVMGAAYPLLPAAIDQVLDESGRPLPRLYQYRIAENLDLTFENQPWNVLRALVETCDLVHRAAEIRIADITRMDLSFSLTDECIDSIMVEENVTHSKAAKIGRERFGGVISAMETFWENPYPELNRSFNEWITEFLWNHITYDGTPVYCRYNLGGKAIGLELIDPSTIKVLLNNRGGRPLPPAPAFQQILWGFPRGEFVANPEAENDPDKQPKNLYAGPGRNGEFKTDELGYFKRNPRTWSAYGYSVVEECIPAATLWLERQAWLLADYQSGSMAAGYIEAPSDKIDIKNISAWNRILNDRLNGQTGQRQQMQYIPEGSKVTFAPTNEMRYKADLDEYVIKRIAAIFGISPQTLGVIPHAGMGGGKGAQEGEAENAETISQKPMLSFVADMINSCSRRWLGMDKNVTAVFNDVDSGSQGDLLSAQSSQISLFSGQVTLNDIQEANGRPSYEMPEADEPFIVTGNTIQFLNGLLAQNADGEVTGQNGQSRSSVVQDGNPVNVNQDDQKPGKEGQKAQEGQDGGDKGGASKAPLDSPPSTPAQKALVGEHPEFQPLDGAELITREIATFNRFLTKRKKMGTWRDFSFTHVDFDKAGLLNYEGRVAVEGRPDILKEPRTLESIS